MINPTIFYSAYQVNYFDYKLAYLTHTLDNFKNLYQEDIILNYSEDDFQRAIKQDIRQTLYQAIETVFEIFFALFPNKKGQFLDRDILRTLSRSEFPYKKINELAEDEKNLSILDEEVYLSDGSMTNLGEYIFFFGLFHNDEVKDKIQESIYEIKKALHILAIEFSHRKEYNSYKHGLRIIPAIKQFKIMSGKNKDKQITFDLSDSMTYYIEDEEIGKYTFVTKVFDTNRDIRLIRICSDLLWNMIKARDIIYNKLKDKETMVFPVMFFEKDRVEKANRVNVQMTSFQVSTSAKKN